MIRSIYEGAESRPAVSLDALAAAASLTPAERFFVEMVIERPGLRSTLMEVVDSVSDDVDITK